MAKTRTEFVCRECGATALRWSGRCPGCDEWNTLIEREVDRAVIVATGRAAAKVGLVPLKG